LADAGAARPARDAVDLRVVTEVRNKTGAIIDSPRDFGGYPDSPLERHRSTRIATACPTPGNETKGSILTLLARHTRTLKPSPCPR